MMILSRARNTVACKTLQLYESNLYKCAPIAYIGDVLEKFGMENDPDWKPYLNYEPLTLRLLG